MSRPDCPVKRVMLRSDRVVVIPTYNEAGNIERLVNAIKRASPATDILIVDDNSPDGTGKIARDLAGRVPGVRCLIRRSRARGLGRSYIDGFRYVLLQDKIYQYIIEMDADFSHDPGDLVRLFGAMDRADIAIGSRYTAGGSIRKWSAARRFLSFSANAYARFFLGARVMDWTSGFRCFSRKTLESADLGSIWSRGYLFQIEILNRCFNAGFSAVEIPIVFTDRLSGKTKLGWNEVLEAVVGVIRLAARYGRARKGGKNV